MSDWGVAHSTVPTANNSLDQQSGASFDESPYFGGALREAVLNGWVPQECLEDMASRILYPMFKHGLIDAPVSRALAAKASIDFTAHAKITQADAEEGMVLLKNANTRLALANNILSISVIGGHADVGVQPAEARPWCIRKA
ncbi:MAG: beta-glucosidase, partial [Lentisphaeria bacterium]